jgi:hypothetical protein
LYDVLSRVTRIALITAVATVTGGWLISGAQATPNATAAGGGNSITATATVDSTYSPSQPTVTIRGQILATGHKYGPRHCLAERAVFASFSSLDGTTHTPDADKPTSRKGRFTFSQIEVDYTKEVPVSGGTVTFTLTLTPARAPKHRGDILDSFRCPPVTATVEAHVPPAPPGYFS